MPKRKANPDIGRVACPIPGCSCTAGIRKQRGAGEMYLVCPEDGRIPPGTRLTEYVLEKGEFFGADGPPAGYQNVRLNNPGGPKKRTAADPGDDEPAAASDDPKPAPKKAAGDDRLPPSMPARESRRPGPIGRFFHSLVEDLDL